MAQIALAVSTAGVAGRAAVVVPGVKQSSKKKNIATFSAVKALLEIDSSW